MAEGFADRGATCDLWSGKRTESHLHGPVPRKVCHLMKQISGSKGVGVWEFWMMKSSHHPIIYIKWNLTTRSDHPTKLPPPLDWFNPENQPLRWFEQTCQLCDTGNLWGQYGDWLFSQAISWIFVLYILHHFAMKFLSNLDSRKAWSVDPCYVELLLTRYFPASNASDLQQLSKRLLQAICRCCWLVGHRVSQ